MWLKMGGLIRRLIVGRVEAINDWALSEIMFFEQCAPFTYQLAPGAPIFKGEDPSIAIINGEIIFFFVHVEAHFPEDDRWVLETKCYRGFDVLELNKFGSVPGKDNRVCVTPGGSVAFSPRPQGDLGGAGAIAYTEVACIEAIIDVEVTEEMLIPELIPSSANAVTWGGMNQILCIRDSNRLGFVSHGGEFSDSFEVDKVYSGLWSILDLSSRELSRPKIVAVREDFPKTRVKLPGLERVFFPSGLDWDGRGFPLLYGGLSDGAVGAKSMAKHGEISSLYNRQ